MKIISLLKKDRLLISYTLILLIPILRKTIFNRAREYSDYATVDSNNIIAIIVSFIMFGIILQNIKTIKVLYKKISSIPVYYYFCIISFLWAGISDLPIIFYKAFENLVCYFFIILILVRIKDWNFRLLYIIYLSSIITMMDLYASKGWHNNAYPMTGMIVILLSLGSLKYKIYNLKEVLIPLIIGWTAIILGTSSASNISLVLGLLLLYGSGENGKNIFLIIFFGIILYFIYNKFEKEIFEFLLPGKNKESVSHMTGRTYIWEIYLKAWQKQPLLGYGYIVGEKNGSHYGYVDTTTAHNMIISLLINTGIIGLIIYLKALWVCVSRTYKNASYNRYASMLIPVLLALILNSNSFPGIGSEWSYVTTVCFLVIVFSYILPKNIKQ